MKYLFCLLFAFCNCALAADPLYGVSPYSVIDVGLEAVYDAELIVDSHQTHTIQDVGGVETNPLLGHHPSQQRTNEYFLLSAVAHGAISYFLPRPWREAFQGVSIVVEGGFLHRNDSRGFGFNFRL